VPLSGQVLLASFLAVGAITPSSTPCASFSDSKRQRAVSSFDTAVLRSGVQADAPVTCPYMLLPRNVTACICRQTSSLLMWVLLLRRVTHFGEMFLIMSRRATVRLLSVTLLFGTLILSACSDGRRSTDTIIDRVVRHIEPGPVTSVAALTTAIQDSPYMGSGELRVVSTKMLRTPSPNSRKPWIHATIWVRDRYAKGPAGQPTQVTQCYTADFSYYGVVGSASRISCPKS